MRLLIEPGIPLEPDVIPLAARCWAASFVSGRKSFSCAAWPVSDRSRSWPPASNGPAGDAPAKFRRQTRHRAVEEISLVAGCGRLLSVGLASRHRRESRRMWPAPPRLLLPVSPALTQLPEEDARFQPVVEKALARIRRKSPRRRSGGGPTVRRPSVLPGSALPGQLGFVFSCLRPGAGLQHPPCRPGQHHPA
jgi:hypothetical protein